jgi:hypothetical protein
MLKNVDVKTGASELDSSMKFEANAEREIQELADGRREQDVFELPGNEGELGMDKKKKLGIGGDGLLKGGRWVARRYQLLSSPHHRIPNPISSVSLYSHRRTNVQPSTNGITFLFTRLQL